MISADDPAKVLQVPFYRVTKVGQQIMSLGKFTADMDYLQQVAKLIIRGGFKVMIGDVQADAPGTYVVVNAQEVVIRSTS